MMYQNNDLKKTLIKSNMAKKKSDQEQQEEQQEQQTCIKDPEQECSRSKI